MPPVYIPPLSANSAANPPSLKTYLSVVLSWLVACLASFFLGYQSTQSSWLGLPCLASLAVLSGMSWWHASKMETLSSHPHALVRQTAWVFWTVGALCVFAMLVWSMTVPDFEASGPQFHARQEVWSQWRLHALLMAPVGLLVLAFGGWLISMDRDLPSHTMPLWAGVLMLVGVGVPCVQAGMEVSRNEHSALAFFPSSVTNPNWWAWSNHYDGLVDGYRQGRLSEDELFGGLRSLENYRAMAHSVNPLQQALAPATQAYPDGQQWCRWRMDHEVATGGSVPDGSCLVYASIVSEPLPVVIYDSETNTRFTLATSR